MSPLLAPSKPYDEPDPIQVEIARQIEPGSNVGKELDIEDDERRRRLCLTGSTLHLLPTVRNPAIVEATQHSSGFSLPTAADPGRRASIRSSTVRPDDQGQVTSAVSGEPPSHPLSAVRLHRYYAALRIALLGLIVAGCSSEGAGNATKDGKEIMSPSEFKEIARTAKNQRNFNKILQKKLMEDTGTIETGPRTKGKRRP